MNYYIGTKLVQAEPCKAWVDSGDYRIGHEGYKVIYSDGHESWSPKDVFEKAYLKVKGNTYSPNESNISVSQEMVNNFIREVHVTTMGEKNTVVRAVLVNGFEIVESSACVDPKNYSEKLGAEICMEKIKDKVWMLFGFLLQTAKDGVK